MLKYCSKCKEEKNFEKFYKCKVTKDGFCTWCKKCFDEKSNKQYNKNKENGICVNCRSKSEEGRIRCRFCAEKNSKRIKDYRKTERGKEVIARIQRKYRRKCYDSDIQFRIENVLRNRFARVLKGKTKLCSSIRDLGCTKAELMVHIENQFLPGMAWENYGRGKSMWSIDNIIPFYTVDLTDREQVLKVCHYTNLRPLWQIDNIKRYHKEKEFWRK